MTNWSTTTYFHSLWRAQAHQTLRGETFRSEFCDSPAALPRHRRNPDFSRQGAKAPSSEISFARLCASAPLREIFQNSAASATRDSADRSIGEKFLHPRDDLRWLDHNLLGCGFELCARCRIEIPSAFLGIGNQVRIGHRFGKRIPQYL